MDHSTAGGWLVHRGKCLRCTAATMLQVHHGPLLQGV